MKIKVDFSKSIRPIGKLNGMNNGPINTYTDRTPEFLDMGVDFVRFHETHACNTKCIEIPFVFRDFDADENDPDNYYFEETDAVILGAVNAGIEVMYRLGMGTETPTPKIFVTIPKDWAKWARIVTHIMDHYNAGWANGYKLNVRYWEIWNEADLYEYWPGTRESYIDFYCTVAPLLKAHDPENRIGTCGFALICDLGRNKTDVEFEPKENSEREAFFRTFLRRVRDERIPMDFFAWHFYTKASAYVEVRMRVIDTLLSDYGLLGKTEVINTEWNQVGGGDLNQTVLFHNAVGALGSMIAMQHHGVTKAAYYDAEDRSGYCGLYKFDGTKLPHYFVMKAFKMLREGKTQVESGDASNNIRICASWNGKNGAIILTNEGQAEQIRLDVKNLPVCTVRYWTLDEGHLLTKTQEETYRNGEIRFPLLGNTAIILQLDEIS